MGCPPEERERGDLQNAVSVVFPLPQEKWPNKVSLSKNTVFLPENCAFLLSVHFSFISLIVTYMVVEVIPI